MLLSLHIRDFVIVEEANIQLQDGFTVFSGQTGAGKSILIDALALTLGQRADATVIREGANKADISAVFDTNTAVTQWLQAHELDNDEVILRRTLDCSGKSKAFINGTPATLNQLKELGEMLIDIHGQHAHQSLLNLQSQRQLLDTHAGIENQTHELQQLWKQWQHTEKRMLQARVDSQRQQAQEEQLQWQWQELENLKPVQDEWQQINLDYNRLSHAATLIEGIANVMQQLDNDEQGVLQLLNRNAQRIRQLVSHDPLLEGAYQSLDSARIACNEATHDLHNYLDKIELDPQRLDIVERRMRSLFDTAKKFHVEPEQLPQLHAEISEKLNTLHNNLNLDTLQTQIEQTKSAYMALAHRISNERKQAATRLSQEVTQSMQMLAMQGGQFAVELIASEPTAFGLEEVQFKVAGHTGSTPRALNKIASGGELARISLALSVIANKAKRVPTLIFDEVDSGIGGSVAEVVGRLLRELGQRNQVLCVTHLAQVAACANHHFEVRKQQNQGITRTDVTRLDEKQRIQEIARMLGGLKITSTTLKHAQEMLALYS